MEKVVYKDTKYWTLRIKGSINYILVIIRLMIKEHKYITLLWISLTIGSSAFPALNVFLNKLSIDNINKIQDDNSYIKTSIIILLMIAIANVVYAVLNAVIGILYTRIKKEIDYFIQKKLYVKLKDIPLEKFEDSDFYKKLSLAQEGIYRNCLDIINYFLGVIQEMLVIAGVIYILAVVHWSLPIALLASAIPGIIAIFLGKTLRYKLKFDSNPVTREMAYTSGLFFNRQSIKEIKIFNIGDFLVNKWSSLFNSFFKESISLSIKEEKAKAFGVLILQFSNALISILLLTRIAGHQISLGSFVSLTTAAITIQGSLVGMWGKIGEIFEINLFTKELIGILEQEDNDQKSSESKININNIERIEISNLFFKYPGSERMILNNLNMTIEKGEKVAIVGDNGAGKTTLINIILGLYTSYFGQIKVNGIDLNEIDIKSYNSCVSAVLQDFIKYIYSIKENIMIGNISLMDNDKLFYEIVKQVGLEKRLSSFATGMDTMLSKEYDYGEELSGGEWQKVAIARAIVRDADIVILDEPTSALDPLAEMEIFKLFSQVSKDKTTIMISHRLGITRFADKIIVLKDGYIVEMGTHEQLMQLQGVYKTMFEAQASWYK